MSVIVMKNYADLLAMSELTQKDGKTFFLWSTWQGYYLHVLSWPSVNITIFWSFTKRSAYKRWSLAEYVFKRNCCHACHSMFAVFFPLPWLCVSSLFSLFSAPCYQNSWAAEPLTFCYVKNLYDWRQTSNNLSIIARVTKLFKCGQLYHVT